jgi:RND family efflux transporter MFP subunit
MRSLTNAVFFGWIALLIFIMTSPVLRAQEKPAGPPPANVSLAGVEVGMVAPRAEFIGTVFFEEVSEVASEVEGLVEAVQFEDGQRVKKDQILVELGSELLQKSQQATVASFEQVLTQLEIARIELGRKEKLFQRQSVSQSAYDEDRFRVKGLEKRVAALKAEVERIEIELRKKRIRAPFAGVVVDRRVDRGEWLSAGETVAVIARDAVVDVVAEIPEKFIPFVRKDMQVDTTVNGQLIKGRVFTIVPRGDVATRTFPVKVRIPNNYSLIEGMSAKLELPTGTPQRTLIVPRDAVITMKGQTVVFSVTESKAAMIPVTVVGYENLKVGIEAPGLTAGMFVVVEGNERLRDGQPVAAQQPEM